jgi:RNA polymerase sigma-70 factor (ECF subfamily)
MHFAGAAEPVHEAQRIPGVSVLVHSPVVASTRPMARELAHLSDEAVLALVARSEEQALAEIYDRFGSVAYGLALRVLRDEGLAQDAVQDAFLTVWRTARSFAAERGAARTWILTLVHRRAVDVVRREERRRGDPLESAPEPVATEQTDQLAWLRFERERVQSALRKLPDQQREALELAYYGGFSQSQLAERLGEPLGTIKSRMHTGLARLRELLEAEDTQWTSSTS